MNAEDIVARVRAAEWDSVESVCACCGAWTDVVERKTRVCLPCFVAGSTGTRGGCDNCRCGLDWHDWREGDPLPPVGSPMRTDKRGRVQYAVRRRSLT